MSLDLVDQRVQLFLLPAGVVGAGDVTRTAGPGFIDGDVAHESQSRADRRSRFRIELFNGAANGYGIAVRLIQVVPDGLGLFLFAVVEADVGLLQHGIGEIAVRFGGDTEPRRTEDFVLRDAHAAVVHQARVVLRDFVAPVTGEFEQSQRFGVIVFAQIEARLVLEVFTGEIAAGRIVGEESSSVDAALSGGVGADRNKRDGQSK